MCKKVWWARVFCGTRMFSAFREGVLGSLLCWGVPERHGRDAVTKGCSGQEHEIGNIQRECSQKWGIRLFSSPVGYLQFQLRVGWERKRASQQIVRFWLREALRPVLSSFWSVLSSAVHVAVDWWSQQGLFVFHGHRHFLGDLPAWCLVVILLETA